MKKLAFITAICLGLWGKIDAQKVQILPIPQQVEISPKILRIDRKFEVSVHNLPSISQLAINRFIGYWEKKTLKKCQITSKSNTDFDF